MSAGFPAGGGELGGLIRTYDWASTPLGPPEEWPQALQIATRIMLTSRQPIWIGWGEELTYLYNDPYKAIVGGKHPDALGRPTREVWSEIWDVIEPMLATALEGNEGTYVESQLLIMERYGYREETYYTFSYSPIPSDDGGTGGIICANTDDTQRVIGERQIALLRELAARVADARRASEARTRALEGLVTNRRDLPFAEIHLGDAESLAANEEWPLAEAAARREIVVVATPPGRDLPTGPWDEPPAKVALVPLAAGGVLVAGLNPFRLFDAGYSDFLQLVGGQISAGIAAAHAYEQERRRAEALAELDHAKTVFFSNVSHEFRTPLTLMLGPLEELLDGEHRLDAASREALEAVRRNSLRLLRMVNTVLDFSRAGSKQTAGDFRPTDLAALTAEIAGRFGRLIERGGVRFTVDCAPLPAAAYVDAEAWEKIVLNLLSNAFKFTMQGEIGVQLTCDGDRVELRVRDTGTGIPSAELPHLFERFHRVRNEQARTHEGTGIGLALVRELVELHGGAIAVESEVGAGTTFTVSMPLGAEHLPEDEVLHEERLVTTADLAVSFTEEASRWIGLDETPELDIAPGDASTPAGMREDARVAVVDDNADMRRYLARILSRHFRVDAYADGLAALEAIRIDPPDLVVTDVMMPRLDGFGLLRALRDDRRTATLPVVVVSARAGEESSVEGLDAGADDYLVKPFSARELVARVRVNLELARLRAEAGRLSALEDVRSRVVTTVSHELRTPVSAIYGAARTLDLVDGIDEELRSELIAVIGSESERLARITNDILTAETLASGIVSLEPARVDLREVVQHAVSAINARADDRHRIVATVPEQEVTAEADASRLEQVLGNLLDNAIKYSPDGGDVHVRLEQLDGHVRLAVADHGLGIPPEARDQVFHRFFRVDPELTGGVGGSGLGLYICREIVEAMGGSIALEANEPHGSRFVVTLPATT